MTKREWLECRESGPMLEFIRGKASPRKLRLLACALIRAVRPPGCDRTIWDLLPDCEWFFSWTLFPLTDLPASDLSWHEQNGHGRLYMSCHQVVEAMEDHADGRISRAKSNAAKHFGDYIAWAAEADTFDPATRPPHAELHYSLSGVVGATTDDEDELIRGMRYTQMSLSPWEERPGGGWERRSTPEHQDQICRTIREIINPFRSRSPEVAQLHGDYRLWARCIYESREVRFMGRMADLLAETITNDQELLTHLRSGGPHFRGCWAIDELLGLA